MSARATDMQRFWDARAREDALFFVDDRVPYRQADVGAFFAGGEEAVAIFERELGFTVRGDRLVDLGCGVGRLTRVLAKRAREVVALDVSPEMLARAKEHNPHLDNVRWVHGDGASLAGIEDGWADGVFSHVVFQHIPDAAITLGYVAEIGRVLAPGGWAAFQVSDEPAVHESRSPRLGERLRARLGRAPRGREHRAWLGSAVSIADLRRTADAAGLDVERVVGEGTQYCLVRLRRR